MNEKPCNSCSERYFFVDINECTGCKAYFAWRRNHSDTEKDKKMSEFASRLKEQRGY